MAAVESINLKSSVILLFLGLFVFSSVAPYSFYFFGISQSYDSIIQQVNAQSKSFNSTFSVNCKKGFEPSSSGKECVPIPSPHSLVCKKGFEPSSSGKKCVPIPSPSVQPT